MEKILLFIILIWAVSTTTGFSQEGQNKDEKAEARGKRKAGKAEKRAKRIREGAFLITPVGMPGYTPELGGFIAGGGLMSFKTKRSDSLIQRSSLPVTLAYSTTGAIVVTSILTSYWFKDKLRINGDFWYKDMPDNYWGVGYESAFNNYQSDSTTAYKRHWWWINPRFLYQVKKNYFAGINVDYNYTKGNDASMGVAIDSTYMEYNDKPLNSGVGVILRYDSRDIPVDAWDGMLIDIRATVYSKSLGGDNNYQVYQLDYRQFKTLFRVGQVLAWQVKTRIAEGNVPYGEMSQIGTPFDLRGYMWGRYRNNDMIYLLAEYRHAFLKNNGDLSKHHTVAWIAAGTIFNTQTIKDYTNRWLPNFGVGYRFEIQPRMSVRLDFGIGRESTGIYFNFNQAF